MPRFGGHGGGFRGFAPRRPFFGPRFGYGGGYWDPYVPVVIDEPTDDDPDFDQGDPTDAATSSGGALEKVQTVIAQHEAYWAGLAQRHPNSDLMRWFLTSQWDPFYGRFVDLLANHGLSEDDQDVLASVLAQLKAIRHTAKQYGIALPPVDDAAVMGLDIGYPHVPVTADDARDLADAMTERSPAQELDDATDQRFWATTGYKPGQKLNPHDPHDRKMINAWLRIRYEVAQQYAAQHDEVAMSEHSAGQPQSGHFFPPFLFGFGLGAAGGRLVHQIAGQLDPSQLASIALVKQAYDAVYDKIVNDRGRTTDFYLYWNRAGYDNVTAHDSIAELTKYAGDFKNVQGFQFAAAFKLNGEALQLIGATAPGSTVISSGAPRTSNESAHFVGRSGGHRDRTPDEDRLVALAPVVAAGANGVDSLNLQFDRDTHVLSASVCIDGRCYSAQADMSTVVRQVTSAIASYHDALHGNAHAPAAVGAVRNELNRAIGCAGDVLAAGVMTHHKSEYVGSWWHDLTHKVSSAVKSVSHEVTHPQELVKDATHYALHPSDLIRKTAQDLGAGQGLAKAISYAVDPVQDLTENAQVQQMAATMFGGPAGVAALNAAQAIDSGKATVAQTLTNFAPQIAAAATNAASSAAGPAAGALAGALVNAATGTGNVQQVANQAIAAATQAASSDPTAKAALDAAHQAVSAATVAHHVAQTVANAASGNQDAAQQLQELTSAANQGDAAAQQLVSAAKDIGDAVQANDTADAAVSQGVADLRSIGSAVARDVHVNHGWSFIGVRADATDKATSGMAAQYRPALGFSSLDEADNWFGEQQAGSEGPFAYLAIYDATDPTWPAPINDSVGQAAAEHVSGFIPGLLLMGAGFGAGAYFWPALRSKLAAKFPKWFGGTTKVSGQLHDPRTHAAVGAAHSLRDEGIKLARAGQRKGAGPYIGISVERDGGTFHAFDSLDDADDWFGTVSNKPHIYVAYYDATDPTWPAPVNESSGNAHVSGALGLIALGALGGGAYGFYRGVHQGVNAAFAVSPPGGH
jgi:hypothetical protein